jgi:hypothetical protein
VKINLNRLYDILGSDAARRQFEDSIIKRLRVKLDWVKKRVDSHNANAERLLKTEDSHNGNAGRVLKIEDIYKQLPKIGELLEIKLQNDDAIVRGTDELFFGSDHLCEYNKIEWTAIVGILQTLTGEDPGDVEPFDTESITEVLIEYRRWANRAKPGCIRSDEKSQKPSISAAPRLSEAIEWAISEVGHPARDVPLKTFCAKVWERCGVDPGAKGYSSRTIRRLVANRRN